MLTCFYKYTNLSKHAKQQRAQKIGVRIITLTVPTSTTISGANFGSKYCFQANQLTLTSSTTYEKNLYVHETPMSGNQRLSILEN